MSDWTITLEFRDGSSQKFWRACAEGSDFVVNYGRIGTDGQSKTKTMASPEKAQAELEKVANQKRKKGYDDVDGAAPAAKTVAQVPEVKNKKATFKVKRGDKTTSVELATDGATIATAVAETLASPEAAAASYDEIALALVSAGYKQG